MTPGPGRVGYVLDNQHPTSESHHAGLGELFDRFCLDRVLDLFDRYSHSPDGKLCLEVGAGAGSFARLLAEEVGPAGRVLAVDKDTSRLAADRRLPQLHIAQADITDPGQLGTIGGSWDLIHARLVLQHLPARRHVLHRLAGMLAPGGLLLVEDWYAAAIADMVAAAPTPEAGEAYLRYQAAAGRVFEASGTDRRWARDGLLQAMLGEDLSDVETVVYATSWHGGGPGCRAIRASIEQLWPKLLGAGLTGDDLTEVGRLLSDPRLVLWGFPLYSTSGRRPA